METSSNIKRPAEPYFSTNRRRALIPWLVALIGASASFCAFIEVHNDQETRIQNEFVRRAQSIANLMDGALRTRQETLRSLRDLFHYSDVVTREEFDRAAQELIGRYKGIESLKWAPRIPADQRSQYEKVAQSDGYPNFEFFEAGPAVTPTAAAARQEYFPVFFSAPFDRNPQALGFDLVSSPAWPDFQAAAVEGEIRASGPVPGVTGAVANGGYLMELPVYWDSVPGTAPERAGLLRGYVLGVFAPSVVLENMAAQVPRLGLDILLVDRVSVKDLRVLHFHPSDMRTTGTSTPTIDTLVQGRHHYAIISFGGRVWELWFRPAPEWLASQRAHLEYVIAGFGLLISALLAFYFRAVFRQTTAVETLVNQRTAELTAAQQDLRNDIRRRIETERALKASEERYRAFVSQSTDAIWRLELPDPIPVSLPLDVQLERIFATGLVAECNELTAQMDGHKQAADILGHHVSGMNPRSRQRLDAVLRAFVNNGYRLAEYEFSDTASDGSKRIFAHNLIGVLEDKRLARIWVTEHELTRQRQLEQERQAFERRLGEAQRLESLGVLAGGIAHDFNNLLTGIMGHASLGRCEIAASSPLHSHFEQIESASRSAANLCQQMLAYAGKGRFIVKPYNLSQIVSQTGHLLHISASKHAELRFNLAEGLPGVMADSTQLQQIVMNLVTNASESISQRSGLITLTTGLMRPDAKTFADCPYAPETLAPAYVFLEVRDNGCGMTPELRSRIFEPFFTTKFAGRGLGLAAALGIVRGHSGALRVESTVGKGSVFTLYLPALEPEPGKDEVASTTTNTPWSAEGTILVIDDEAPVRGVAERMAKTIGFGALSAADGDQGIQFFNLYRAGIKIVLLDLSMPGLSGEDTLAGLRAIDPTVRIVVMSGYNQPDLPASSNGRAPLFLPKPFSLAQFQTAIRQAMLHG